MFEDMKLALWGLWRNLGFAVLAVFVLATGIGATTTVFSAVDAVLLRPLPYPHADRIATIVRKQFRSVVGDGQYGLTFRFLRANQRSFGAFAAVAGPSGMNFVSDGGAAYVRALGVTSDYFRVLGVEPALGRSFGSEEEEPAAGAVALLSYGFWQTHFAGRPDVLGREVRLMGSPYNVIGVMPASFRSFSSVDLWIPLKTNDPRGSGLNYTIVGRLKDGVAMDQADAEMAARLSGISGATWNTRSARRHHSRRPAPTTGPEFDGRSKRADPVRRRSGHVVDRVRKCR